MATMTLARYPFTGTALTADRPIPVHARSGCPPFDRSGRNGARHAVGRAQLRSNFAKSSQKKPPRIGSVTARMIVDSEKMIGTCDWCEAVMVQL